MALEVFCTNLACRRRFVFPDTTAGKSVRCQSCGETFVAAPASATAVTLPPRRAAAAPPPPDLVGSTLGRFVVGERLGAGAFGTVYRAFDPVLDRDVALKVPNPGVTADPKRVERFLREAKAAGQLRHPNIVPVFDAGTDGGRYYIASAFVEGRPLSDAIPPGGEDFTHAARLVRDLAGALAYAHEQGIVHRDVKPANVMVDALRRPHLMDFGLAARHDDEDRITHYGAVLGTAAYMAPEQAAGQKGEARPAVDQYAAGVVLYELLTGHLPFDGPLPVILHNVMHTDPDPPRVSRPDVPRDLQVICLKAMAKRPVDRYPDCGALADDLRRFLEGEPILARPPGVWERAVRWVRKEPKLAAAGVVIAMLVMLGAGLVYGTAVRAQKNARAQAELRQESERERDAARVARDRAEGLVREKEQADLNTLGALGTAAEERAKVVAALRRVDEARHEMHEEQRTAAAARKAAEGEHAKVVAALSLVEDVQAEAEAAVADAEKRVADARGELAAARRRVAQGVSWYADIIQRAQAARAEGQQAKADALLETIPADFRNWEWWHLRKSWTPGELALRKGEFAETKTFRYLFAKFISANLSPSGTQVVTTSLDGKVRVWEWRTRKLLLAVDWTAEPGLDRSDPSPSPYPSAVFSPDGTHIATVGWRKAVGVWEIKTGKEVVSLKGNGDQVWSAAFSPDGTRIAAGGQDQSLRVWEVKTGKLVFTTGGRNGSVLSVAFSPDGKRIVTADRNGSARVWDAADGKELVYLTWGKPDVWSATFSPDGKRIVTADRDKKARVYDAVSGNVLVTLGGHDLGVVSAAFNADGTRILTASGDTNDAGAVFRLLTGRKEESPWRSELQVWDAETGVHLLTLWNKGVISAAWSGDGSSVVAACTDGVVRVFGEAAAKK